MADEIAMKVSRSAIPNLCAPNEEAHRSMEKLWKPPPGIVGWLCDTNHKHIAMRYIVTAFIFFGLAGILALLMRIQLAFPKNHFLSPDLYNQFFTVHGTTMMFLFAVPIMEGMGLYFVPLMIGTRNVAFPRLNAFGYYVFLAGAVVNITTVFKQRAPGMSLNRIPLFVWAQVVTSFMILFAMPAVMLVSGYLAMDRLA